METTDKNEEEQICTQQTKYVPPNIIRSGIPTAQIRTHSLPQYPVYMNRLRFFVINMESTAITKNQNHYQSNLSQLNEYSVV